MTNLKFTLLSIAILASIESCSQSNKVALRLYNDAVKALQVNNYQSALDLLNESIDIMATSESYVNRAVCKLKLGDADGYCEDLRNAYRLIDKDAYSAYWKDCGIVDTSFVDSIGRRCSRAQAVYKRVIRTPFMMTYEQEMELFSKSGESVCTAKINAGDTLYQGGTLLNAPVWINKEDWLMSIVKLLGDDGDNFQLRMNVYSDGTVGEVEVLGLTKEGRSRVIEYAERIPPEFKPAMLWNSAIDLRVTQKVKSN
jgi:tetratricopeptide (TPR) repeat protein